MFVKDATGKAQKTAIRSLTSDNSLLVGFIPQFCENIVHQSLTSC